MILGIDPGIRKLGYALIKSDLSIVEAGVLIHEKQTKKAGSIDGGDARLEQWERMNESFAFFEAMLLRYEGEITHMSMEKLYFMARNQNNAEFVYGIRGALMMLFFRHKVQLHEYTPIQLKKYITGNAKASKDLMMQVITNVYGLEKAPDRHDTADALGLAYLAKQLADAG